MNNEHIQDRFIGAWRLVWLEEPGAKGEIHKADCTGMLVYTRDGHVSVQVMYRNPETGGQGGPVQYAQSGYEASFRKYEIDEEAHTFTFHVEGAMAESLGKRRKERGIDRRDHAPGVLFGLAHGSECFGGSKRSLSEVVNINGKVGLSSAKNVNHGRQ